MGTTSELHVAGTVIWYDATIFTPMEPRIFEPDWLRKNGNLLGSSRGRSEAYFLNYSGRDMVLRHFQRGGILGKFVSDHYITTRIDDSRAMREFTLLDWMRMQGLPVPRPLAARFSPSGPFYRADLLTERIQNARPLAEVLLERALPDRNWFTIGATIGQMHSLSVFHADLNCRNILLDAGERAWIIDFDKCETRAPGGWMKRNLFRLQRSFEKEKHQRPDLNWVSEDWTVLLSGYSHWA
ncbi:MAG: 3-deoxy-D-manno-octulosonic acid kinase [Boseongicola sp. SB0673_bin_14]|nr:3-deoxy-D-manno-octulosonic acid kinase [Boseongicola sp. SB0673_bin_14]